jgi:hypothetical protein
MAAPSPLYYHRIYLPSRENSRTPISEPRMSLIAGPGGRLREVGLSEAQLHAIIQDATATLRLMYKCRETRMKEAGWTPPHTTSERVDLDHRG